MARRTTDEHLAKLKPKAKQYAFNIATSPGLQLRVSPGARCNAPEYPSQNLLISSTIGQSEKAGGLTCV